MSNPNDSVKVALSQTRDEHDVDCSIWQPETKIINYYTFCNVIYK